MNKDLLECMKNYKFINIKVVNDSKYIGINEFVKKIYVINLFEDIRKRNYITILFKKYMINYNLIIVDRVDKKIYDKLVTNSKISVSELGCCMSHMWCLIDIIKNQYEKENLTYYKKRISWLYSYYLNLSKYLNKINNSKDRFVNFKIKYNILLNLTSKKIF